MIELGLARVEKNPNLITHLPQVSAGNIVGLFGGGLFRRVHESFAGAWQRGIEHSVSDVLTQSTVWSCLTLIASDVGKLGVRLIAQTANDIWVPTTNTAYSSVLRKPNHYQNRIKFFESWVISKLSRGNTYILKARDGSQKVRKLFILDPTRVQVLISPAGSVYYQLAPDNLSGLQASVTVPASEIIHDVGVPLYHPLCGLPPIVASYLAASQSLNVQTHSAKFFQNNSKPGGVLSGPGRISQETADRIQAHWQANFGGEDNIGKVAVLGDGLEFKPMAVTAVDAQLVDQLKWTDEKICATFHVPPFMVGVGPMPTYDNIEKLNQQYYSQCLQALLESIELCLDEGLDLPSDIGVEFDLEALMRMDSATRMKNATEGVKGGVLAPNEARKQFNLPPVEGGAKPYLQQQNYSLEALAKRDGRENPFERSSARRADAAVTPDTDAEEERALAAALRFKSFIRRQETPRAA